MPLLIVGHVHGGPEAWLDIPKTVLVGGGFAIVKKFISYDCKLNLVTVHATLNIATHNLEWSCRSSLTRRSLVWVTMLGLITPEKYLTISSRIQQKHYHDLQAVLIIISLSAFYSMHMN